MGREHVPDDKSCKLAHFWRNCKRIRLIISRKPAVLHWGWITVIKSHERRNWLLPTDGWCLEHILICFMCWFLPVHVCLLSVLSICSKFLTCTFDTFCLQMFVFLLWQQTFHKRCTLLRIRGHCLIWQLKNVIIPDRSWLGLKREAEDWHVWM